MCASFELLLFWMHYWTSKLIDQSVGRLSSAFNHNHDSKRWEDERCKEDDNDEEKKQKKQDEC